MKRIMLLALGLVLGLAVASAQAHEPGEMAVGGLVVYGSDIENVGLGGFFQYCILEQVRGEAGYNFYFPKHDANFSEFNINAHYLLSLWEEKLYLFPIAGLNYSFTSLKDKILDHNYEENHIGLNLGCGVEYQYDDHIGFTARYRHTLVRKVDQGVFELGACYKF